MCLPYLFISFSLKELIAFIFAHKYVMFNKEILPLLRVSYDLFSCSWWFFINLFVILLHFVVANYVAVKNRQKILSKAFKQISNSLLLKKQPEIALQLKTTRNCFLLVLTITSHRSYTIPKSTNLSPFFFGTPNFSMPTLRMNSSCSSSLILFFSCFFAVKISDQQNRWILCINNMMIQKNHSYTA